MGISIKYLLYLLPILLLLPEARAQDSIHFDKDNYIEGEVKRLQYGVLTVETPYSDDDFTIDWDMVRSIDCSTPLMIYMKDGSFRYGRLSCKNDTLCSILSPRGEIHSCERSDIMGFRELEEKFLDRLDAGIDLGVSLAKANNLRQYTLGANLGYRTTRWEGSLRFNGLTSLQDETEAIRRNELDLVYRYLIFRDWVLDPSIKLLSNTEQKLALRSILKLGAGRYIVKKNNGNLGMEAGMNRNIERYTSDEPDRDSWEAFIETEGRVYNLENLEFLAKSAVYKGITENERWRADFNLNMKYDLPLDFYLKIEWTANFDSQPAAEASRWDYVLQLGFGWDL